MRVPDRRLEPPEPAPPVSSCWYCNEPLYGDSVLTIGGYDCCGDKECVEAVGIEIKADKDYYNFDDTEGYTFADYVLDEYSHSRKIITRTDREFMKVEEVKHIG